MNLCYQGYLTESLSPCRERDSVDCREIRFSSHAIRRMFERSIRKDDVVRTVLTGEVIVGYLEDRPYPSFLMLGWIDNEPLHVVVAVERESRLCIVVTVYLPDPDLWEGGFRKRREL